MVDADHPAAEGRYCSLMQAEGYYAFLGAPVVSTNDIQGVLQLMSVQRHWSDEDAEKLGEFAGLFAAVCDDQFEETQLQALTARIH